MLKPLKLLVLILCLLTLKSYADSNISFGEVITGEARIDLKVSDFTLKTNLSSDIQLKAALTKSSVQWIRTEKVLMTPRARLSINIKGDAQNFYLKYRGQTILLHQNSEFAHSEFYISLFNRESIKVFKNGKFIGDIQHYAKSIPKERKKHLVDYSCAKYKIETQGLDEQFASIGCRSHRIGKLGNEKTMLEVLWSTPNYRVQDKAPPPYMAVFMTQDPVSVKLTDHNGEQENFQIKAKVPKSFHRLNIAYGFGPYVFDTSFEDEKRVNEVLKVQEPIVPALFLYFNLNLTKDSSIRGFDALVFKDSVFNNLGAYYANDIAVLMDTRLTVTTLLGMQHLYFKFDNKAPLISEAIFPQGIEITFKHAFGIENYIISGGAFLSPSESYDYQNIWIRWGKDIFWELNYIFWGNDNFSAKMWGLSAGFFYGGFL